MANYSLVINSKFQPFSFERYILPYLIYGQAYRELELALADLNTKASIWKNMANLQTDREAYKMYKTYSDDLKAAADSLLKKGLNPTSRQLMLNMKSRYSSEIVPIELAYEARALEMKEQRAGKALGIVYEGDASIASLDRYLGNPAIRYGMANSKEGFQRVATAALALSKQLMEYGRGKKLDPYMNTWLLQHGYRDSEVGQAIADILGALQGNGNPRGTNILTSILANEMQTAGVNAWNNAAKMDYYNRIAPALYQAVGLTQVGTFQDQGAIMAAQEASAMRVARYKKELEDADKPKTGVRFNPRIIEGIDSEKDDQYSRETKRLLGFRRAGTLSFTTDELHNKTLLVRDLESKMKSYSLNKLKEFKLYESNIGKPKLTTGNQGGYATVGLAASRSISVPLGYRDYLKLKKQLSEAKSSLADELKFVNDIALRYKHLGNSTYDNVRRGLAIDKLQRAEEISSFVLDAKGTDYRDTVERIGSWLTAFNAKTLDSKTNVGLKGSDGKFLDYEDTKNFFYDDKGNTKNIKVKIKGGKTPKMVLVNDAGEEYSIHGVQLIDKYNKDLLAVLGFLRGFDKESVGKDRTLVSPLIIQLINSGQFDAIANRLNYKPIKGTNYYGTVLYEPLSEDYMKIMVDSEGNLIGVNSLSDEYQGARNRDAYFMNMANRGLLSIIQPASSNN